MTDAGDPAPPADRSTPDDLRPSRENLAWALGRWIGKRTGAEDLVVIAVAGRTSLVPGAGGRDAGVVIWPPEARVDDPDSTGWWLDRELEQWAGERKFRGDLVVLLDAPLTGVTGPAGTLPAKAAGWLRRLCDGPELASRGYARPRAAAVWGWKAGSAPALPRVRGPPRLA